ncbi:PEP-CTERM sorting domain-containing protein [Akkermansiaceae bacterium]|nr:PEP-CTERM sorting domain-containing protein [Akkermansiaceae bacterium]
MKLKYGILTGALCSVMASNAGAALITWQNAVNMFSGDANDASFISTNGVLVDAANGGGTTVTVNGVLFSGITGTQSGGQNLVSGNFSFLNHNDNGSAFGQGGFSGGTADVGTLIQSAIWGAQGVTLTGLTSGNVYEIQILTNDARNNRSDNFISGYGDGVNAGSPAVIAIMNNQPNATGDGPTGTGDNSGQYVIGTFTADATTQTFESFGTNSGVVGNLTLNDSRAQFNGIQLRNLSIPEPSSILLTGLAALGFIGRRRR